MTKKCLNKNKESLPFDEKVLSNYVNSKIPLLQPDFTLGYINNSGTDKLEMDIFPNLSQSFAMRYQISIHRNMWQISGL